MPNDRPSCPACAPLEEALAEARDQLVALERLHLAGDRAAVLEAIQDVVVNIVGSEELAVFVPDGTGALRVVQSLGVDGARVAPVPRDGPVGRAAAERRAWVGPSVPRPDEFARPVEGSGVRRAAVDAAGGEDRDLTAVVPLVSGGRLIAVLAVWRLLGHKPALRDSDRRVLELLGRHAGAALAAASKEARP